MDNTLILKERNGLIGHNHKFTGYAGGVPYLYYKPGGGIIDGSNRQHIELYAKCDICGDEILVAKTHIKSNGLLYNSQSLLESYARHDKLMAEKNILVSVYTNASGFLWQAMKVDSGTDLGYSEFIGDDELSGTYTSYVKALDHALEIFSSVTLDQFATETDNNHWSNFSKWAIKKHKNK